MPIYEYRCGACGHELEKLQKISDEPLRTCPACGKETLEKLVSAAGFRLKGGGWYETDFKNKKQKNLAKGDKPAASPSAGGESGGKDNSKGGKKTSGGEG